MNHRLFLPTAGVILACCTACVDPIFNLDNIQTQGVVFQNMEVPIGNFEEITLQEILKAPDAAMISLQPGTYSMTGSVQVTGISLQLDDQLYFKEAELHTVIVNTLPLDMNFRVTALDEAGNPCQDVAVSIQADQSPMIASGTKSKPSANPVVLRLTCSQTYTTLNGLNLTFSGKTGAGFEGNAPQGDDGITLTQVVLKMPEGFQMNL